MQTKKCFYCDKPSQEKWALYHDMDQCRAIPHPHIQLW